MFRKLRNDFFAGLLVIVPIAITIWIFWGIFHLFDNWFNRLGIYDSLIAHSIFIPKYGVGFVLTIILITLVGFITQLYLGRKLFDLVDYIFLNIPGVSSIYNGLKQVSESLLGKREKIFEAVGLVEYPRKGIYSIVFIIGKDNKLMSSYIGKDVYYIFLATTPNPTSGVFLMVPCEDVTLLDISVEDAMKMIISSGMVTPKKIKFLEKVSVSSILPSKEDIPDFIAK